MFAKKEIYILGAIVILLIGGFVFLGVYLKSDSSSSGDLVSVAEISDFDWIKGDRGAKVVLIEYSDFQCPACAYYSGMVKQLTNDFGNQIKMRNWRQLRQRRQANRENSGKCTI
ncbi:MAG: hypothetical protein US36_C0020G0012 [Candidatus Wolfebacteria bacterium GW2011_GWC1_37_10]|uniref:Thioredoxin-like fold domain-containing protein n=1 Tax=Candidatus Wolfebacteria bacterium GW2011_GWC1_37_10 TaxID=1619010 RepID=A0A0G0IAZ6_9BACT|nr:MAG: hypothetical protein US36_C0020G0012 [Candidatus Wolfebacteria bacterium GW2011_GWC1_37_10]